MILDGIMEQKKEMLINYGLQLIKIYQYWFVNCNKYALSM